MFHTSRIAANLSVFLLSSRVSELLNRKQFMRNLNLIADITDRKSAGPNITLNISSTSSTQFFVRPANNNNRAINALISSGSVSWLKLCEGAYRTLRIRILSFVCFTISSNIASEMKSRKKCSGLSCMIAAAGPIRPGTIIDNGSCSSCGGVVNQTVPSRPYNF